jgi:probable F420-dependent oxidoreductase
MSFRFGVNSLGTGIEQWPDTCRAAQEQGYDVLLVPDHLDAPSPFVLLAVAAAAVDRLRLGTYVLNNEFWNPALLAREIATLDRISGGRVDLGLGSGHMKWEFEDAGLPWRPHPERTGRLAAALDELERRFGAGGHEPAPLQRPRPPLLIGGHGTRTLTLAAERADIVAFSGLTQRRGRRMGDFAVAGTAETRRRVDLVRRHAGERAYESSVLLQAVTVTDDAERAAAELAERYGPGVLPDDEPVLDNPYLLVGTPEEMADTLLRRRREYGFAHIVTHGPFRDALARVIPLVRARERRDA